MKVCTECKLTKSLVEFGKENRTSDGFRQKCKICRKEYRKTHPNKDKRKNRKNRNKIKQVLYSRNYYLAHKEERKEYSKNYRKQNKGKVNANTSKRAAAKKQRTPPWLTKLHYNQIEMFYDSAAALTKELGIPFEVDHIEPLQGKDRSGLHVPWNLQVITKVDNNRKYNKCA